MQPKTMRLYVWENFCPDYTSGLAVAIAPSLKMAQDIIYKKYNDEMGGKHKMNPDWGSFKTYAVDTPRAFQVSGGA